MAIGNDTVTLVLNGDEVSLEEFAKAVGGLAAFLTALHEHVAKDSKVEWYIQALEAGSAIATARCVEDGDTGAVERIIGAYEGAGRTYRKQQKTGVSRRADREFKKIVGLINGRIRSVRFETQRTDVEIFEPTKPGRQLLEAPLAIGTVQGRVEALSKRKGLRFTLYEAHTDRAISCYLSPGSEERMRESWGRLAMIEGRIRRDPTTGLVTTVRDVTDIQLLPEGAARDVMQACGAYKSNSAELPEVSIRRLRDA